MATNGTLRMTATAGKTKCAINSLMRVVQLQDHWDGCLERVSGLVPDGVLELAGGIFSAGVANAAAGVFSNGTAGLAAVVLSLLSFPSGVVPPAGCAAASTLPRMIGRPSLPLPMRT